MKREECVGWTLTSSPRCLNPQGRQVQRQRKWLAEHVSCTRHCPTQVMVHPASFAPRLVHLKTGCFLLFVFFVYLSASQNQQNKHFKIKTLRELFGQDRGEGHLQQLMNQGTVRGLMDDAVGDEQQVQLPGLPDQQICGSRRDAEGEKPHL